MSVEQNIRTFKDFLQFYNLMSETCFSHCINTFKRNEVERDEADCVDKCAMKLMRFNNRSIGVYAEIQNQLVEQRTAELEKEALAQQEKLQEISALSETTITENSESTSVTPTS